MNEIREEKKNPEEERKLMVNGLYLLFIPCLIYVVSNISYLLYPTRLGWKFIAVIVHPHFIIRGKW